MEARPPSPYADGASTPGARCKPAPWSGRATTPGSTLYDSYPAGSTLLFSLNRLPGSNCPLIFDRRAYAGP